METRAARIPMHCVCAPTNQPATDREESYLSLDLGTVGRAALVAASALLCVDLHCALELLDGHALQVDGAGAL